MKCVTCDDGFAYFEIDGKPICIPCFLREPTDEKPRSPSSYLPKRRKLKKPISRQEAAHRLVAVAKRNGYLNPKPCEICGSDWAVQAHHEDYSKPLDVRWLCHRHHSDVTHGVIVL